MMRVVEGSQAVADAAKLARVKVISAYPITPQTHIVEELAKYCNDGTLDGKFICVESEHSAMASVIGAASGGVRAFTASSSHGLALMHEMLHWAAGARLPIVMAEVNRAMGPGWNLWLDQTDSLAQRDTGWIQLYCEDGQEAFDTTIQAFRLAEIVNLPVMVVLDAFFLSHTYEPVDIPTQEEVDRFLPPYVPKFKLDANEPYTLGTVAPPNVYMEFRRSIQSAMESVPEVLGLIEDEFHSAFGRRYGVADAYRCDDAEIVLVMAGTTASTSREVVDELRAKGEKAGLLRLRLFRPFPAEAVARILTSAKKVAVLDRNCSFGVGGIFAQELRAALYNRSGTPVYSYVAGLGGRDVTPDTIRAIYETTRGQSRPAAESVWVGLREEMLKS
jgi:pyruvate/2-oxoacid:ferredoxin oxidoreductase alpha subunit